MNYMDSFEWLLCPVCNSKTRIKLRLDTELKNFPLFCPKCKQETLISVEKFKILVITEPVIGFFIERYDNCFLGGNVVSLCFVRPPNLPKKAQAQDKYILLYVSVKAEDGLKRQRRYEILILEKS